jgi:hypothetical protein
MEEFMAFLKACEILDSMTMTITVGYDIIQPGKIFTNVSEKLTTFIRIDGIRLGQYRPPKYW